MARIRKSYPVGKGYYHREHRSKNGQHKLKVKEIFDPTRWESTVKKDQKKLDLDKLLDFGQIIKKAEGTLNCKPIRLSHKKAVDRFPSLACENCGHIFKLDYSPLHDTSEATLAMIVCPKCNKFAYFVNYYSPNFVYIWYSVAFSFIRDLIKTKQAYLNDFI